MVRLNNWFRRLSLVYYQPISDITSSGSHQNDVRLNQLFIVVICISKRVKVMKCSVQSCFITFYIKFNFPFTFQNPSSPLLIACNENTFLKRNINIGWSY